MKKRTRLLAIFMALCCMFTMSLSAFATSTKTVEVAFDGNDGEFEAYWDADNIWDTDYWGITCEAGKAVNAEGISVKDPVFWDPTREFAGWMVCKNQQVTDDNGNSWEEPVQIPGTGLITTTKLLDYIVPDHDLVFMAQWEGSDDDYYSRVGFNGYDVQLTFEFHQYENGQESWREEVFQGMGTQMKDATSGMTIGDQLAGHFRLKEEPKKNNDVFEGWVEFKTSIVRDENGNDCMEYELVSNNIYTTQEVMNKLVPEYDVEYVAKWKSISLEDYFNYSGGNVSDQVFMAISANGGQISFSVTDEDGNVIEMSVPCEEYCFGDGMSMEFVQQNNNCSGYQSVEKQCAEHMGWTLYECETIDWIEFPHGQECNIGDPDIEIFYFNTYLNDKQEAVDRYIILVFPQIISRNMTTEQLQKFIGSENYFAIANWKEQHKEFSVIENQVEPTEKVPGSYDEVIYCTKCGEELSRSTVPVYLTTQPVPVPEGEAPMRVEVKSELTNVPKELENTYETVNHIKDAMFEAASDAAEGIEEENLLIKHLEVELKCQKEDGTWEIVTHENFPAEGLTVFLPYPEGTNGETKDFVVTHLITSGERAGEIEVLEHTEEADGIYVKVTSLSPFSIVYEKDYVADVFGDISTGKWYEGYVQYVYDNGLMSGSNGLFKPTDNVSRAQLVTTLYRLAGEPEVTDYSACEAFLDVKPDKYYTDPICWAYNEGIATGNPDTHMFNTTGTLTRQQMAAFFYRFAEYLYHDITIRGDISSMINADKVNGYATDAVKWAVGTGLISGSKTTDAAGNEAYDLAPQNGTSRAQLAVILERFCENNGMNL